MEKLYDIANAYESALRSIDIDENGEVHNIEVLEKIDGDFDEKVENIALYIKDTKAMAVAIKEEEDSLSARRKAFENKANYLSRYVAESMTSIGKDKVETPRCRVSFRKSETVMIDNLDLIPSDYKKIKTTETPDKTAIKTAIKSGKVIDGAELVENRNLQIK